VSLLRGDAHLGWWLLDVVSQGAASTCRPAARGVRPVLIPGRCRVAAAVLVTLRGSALAACVLRLAVMQLLDVPAGPGCGACQPCCRGCDGLARLSSACICVMPAAACRGSVVLQSLLLW
jgi:hypothetical protein